MSKILTLIITGTLFSVLYGIFWERINNGIIKLTEWWNNIGCYLPEEIAILFIYVIIVFIVKIFISYVK